MNDMNDKDFNELIDALSDMMRDAKSKVKGEQAATLAAHLGLHQSAFLDLMMGKKR